MALASVVQIGESLNPATALSSWTINLSTTPAAGDVVLLVIQNYSAISMSSVGGLGATWDRSYSTQRIGFGGANSFSHHVYVGTGATASGNITLTFGSTARGLARAFLLRGPSAHITIDTVSAATNTSLTGPSHTAAQGQFVLDLWSSTDTGSGTTNVFPATLTPTTGWVSQTRMAAAIYGNNNTSYRIPSTETAHQLVGTTTTSKTNWITQIVLGVPDTDVPNEALLVASQDHNTGASTWAGSGGTTLTLTTTPQTGDVVVVGLNSGSGSGTTNPVLAGLGATWTLGYSAYSGTSDGGHWFFIGTVGASPTNSLTVTTNGFINGPARTVILRGLGSSTVANSGTGVITGTASGTTVSGPLQSAGSGQVVVALAYAYNNISSSTVSTPLSGWWQNHAEYSSAYGEYWNLHRAPGTTNNHQVTVNAVTAQSMRVSQIVIGGSAPTVFETTGQAALNIQTTASASVVAPITTGQAGLSVGATASAATTGSATGQAALGIGASAAVDNSVVTTGTLPASAGLTSVAYGVTQGQLPLTFTMSSTESSGDATGLAFFTAAASAAAYGATDAVVATQVGLTSAEVLAAQQGLPLSGQGTLTSKLTLRVALDLSGQGSLASSTAFQGLMDSALGGTGTLSCTTASVVPMAVELTAFGTLRSHPQGTTRDNIDVWFAGPVTESRVVTGPAAGVGTGQGPYLENEYYFSGPED